jgi:glucose-6-phosphate-specific signal transduction histidine kinase
MMELLQEMRRLSRTYNPINMPVVSLEEVVKEFLDQFNDGKIQVKLNWQDKLVDLPNEVALILFRVMDGYLRLIRDSGRNGHVGIHISAKDDLDIEIVDDVPYDNSLGSEFEIGLNAILSRIDILEGRYSLECEPGKPHCFKVKLPFPLSIAC